MVFAIRLEFAHASPDSSVWPVTPVSLDFYTLLDWQLSAHPLASVETAFVPMSASVMRAGVEVFAPMVGALRVFCELKLSHLPRRLLSRVVLECSWHLHVQCRLDRPYMQYLFDSSRLLISFRSFVHPWLQRGLSRPKHV
jgi:hypothetical protein